MTLSPQTIQPAVGARRSSRRLGRGHGTGRGKTAGRGTKGQRARTGGKSRNAILMFKRSLQKFPKLRGFQSRTAKPLVVTLSTLERICAAGDIVTPRYLKEKSVIGSKVADAGVKILGTGTITKKITIQGCFASKTAVAAIEKVGGKVVF